MDILQERILVTGGSGMVGSALAEMIPNAMFIDSSMYDLTDQVDTNYLFLDTNPDYVIHLAAKVGGVKANADNLGSFYYDNIAINTNVLEGARKFKVKKVLSLLSTCIYPNVVTYPLTEEQIHDGPPHPSNYAYAYAKRMLDIQSQAYRKQYGSNFITVVPNNLFGEHDNFDLNDSHIIPAVIRKIYEAKTNNKQLILWGDGKPLREFTYSKDLARIVLLLLSDYEEPSPINVGNPKEYSIKEVVKIISDVMDYNGDVVWDTSKPKGQHRKPSSNAKLLNLGWQNKDYTPLHAAIENTYKWFIDNYPNVRGC
tara:strand:- start:7 stop:942 length:936 start_codon:yes stop_codon:yes gene_type:complete